MKRHPERRSSHSIGLTMPIGCLMLFTDIPGFSLMMLKGSSGSGRPTDRDMEKNILLRGTWSVADFGGFGDRTCLVLSGRVSAML